MSFNHSHISPAIAENWFFRKAFLLRKLFLSKNKSSHYGQMGEDIFIKNFFQKEKKGTYIDVGCFHPIKYNNTYVLYKMGWRGINIDIDDIKIEGFRWLRSQDHNVCSAVSQQKGVVSYWSNGFYTPTITMDEEFVKNKHGKKYQYIKKTTTSKPLTQIIDESPFSNQEIDFLSIDVEGFDYNVLSSLDFKKYSPTLIAIESQKDNFTDIQKEDSYQYLISKNYELVNWVGMTLMFRKSTNKRREN